MPDGVVLEENKASTGKSLFKTILQYAVLYIVLFLIYRVSTLYVGSDDSIFVDMTQGLSLFEWIGVRYMEWSSRIFSEAGVYLVFHESVWIWYFITPFMSILLGYSIMRLFSREVKFIQVVLVIALLCLMSVVVFVSSQMWMTGAIYYLWPTALGACAMIPFADAVFRNETRQRKWKIVVWAVFAFCACTGVEQSAACVLGFSIVSIVWLLIKKRRVSVGLWVILIVAVASFILIALAPGNDIRLESNIQSYIPDFREMSIVYKLRMTTVWFFDKFFSVSRMLVLALGGVVLLWSFKQKDRKRFFRLAQLLFLVMFGVALGSQFISSESLYDFNRFSVLLDSGGGTLLQTARALLPYIFWTLYVAGIIILVWQSKHRSFYVLCLLASIAAMYIMMQSPTIYASANRVLFTSNVLYCIIMAGLLYEMKWTENKYNVTFWVGLAAINIVSILSHFANGFYVIY